jgi:hypothetical protein
MYDIGYELAVMQMAERLQQAERRQTAVEARRARRANGARRGGSIKASGSQRPAGRAVVSTLLATYFGMTRSVQRRITRT